MPNITKQNNRHILNISKSSQKGGREGRTTRTQSHSFIQSRISKRKHCQASMVKGLARPTRAVAHSHVTICRRLRIQYVFSTHVWCKPVLDIVFFTAVKPANNILFCIELIQRSESSLRRHKLGLTVVLCSKYRYDDVLSQRFDDTSIDTAGPVSILWHVCSSGPRLI